MFVLSFFIGLKPSPPCLDTLVERQARLLRYGRNYLYLTPPDHVHLTLLPLGFVHRSRIDHIADAMERGTRACEPFELQVGPLDHLNPKVVWAGVQNGVEELKKLREALQRAVDPMGCVSVPSQFTPHWSLARLSSAPDEGTRSHINRFLAEATLPTPEPFTVQRVYLIQSTRGIRSARHDQLAGVPIGGAAREHC
ncbi:MAG: RNA 2',3'-cyclic phosphodiesterase [Dehalococcoidia bacterium]